MEASEAQRLAEKFGPVDLNTLPRVRCTVSEHGVDDGAGNLFLAWWLSAEGEVEHLVMTPEETLEVHTFPSSFPTLPVASDRFFEFDPKSNSFTQAPDAS